MSSYLPAEHKVLPEQEELFRQLYHRNIQQQPVNAATSSLFGQHWPSMIPQDYGCWDQMYRPQQTTASQTVPLYQYPSYCTPPVTTGFSQSILSTSLNGSAAAVESGDLLSNSGLQSCNVQSTRSSRSNSETSVGSSTTEATEVSASARASRATSPGSADLQAYGYLDRNGSWICGYPGCSSRAVFIRDCDFRKHYKRHTKSFFCRLEGCPQSTGGGFSSRKDLARHETKHNPDVMCEWDGCDRVFSRVDNMVCLPHLIRTSYAKSSHSETM